MRPVSDIFKAEADNFENTMNSHGGDVGFRVPEYQRTYDWNKENIKRLLEDCLNGFYYLSSPNNESYTFLGTLILVSENPEPSFDGTSLSIVDGQQRLTTLTLLCCALIEELFLRQDEVCHLQEATISWIKREIEYIHERLFDCVRGQLRRRDLIARFPRVVRLPDDNRGFSPSEAEYRSVIANFLINFANHYSQSDSDFIPATSENDVEAGRFFQNYKYIKEQVKLGIYKGDDTPTAGKQSELDHNQIGHEDFQKSGLRNLFEKLNTLPEQAEKDRAISDIASNSYSSGLIRIMLFSHYVLRSVILTRVETDDEDTAFDIFDSLNTTGEPLTAIETFKPRVMSFERNTENASYSGSESARQFERLEANLNDIYLETDKRQKETKELLVTFALYLEGRKLPLNLNSQRSYLRLKFEEAANSNFKRRIVRLLADIAEFRQTYWNRDSIRTLDSIHPNSASDWLKLCCTVISDMKTSLAIPIMARFWAQYQQDKIEHNFADAVKAITAFLILRRSVTGNTGRIDSDFRKMMGTLCIGLNDSNSIPSLDDFKKILREYLAVRRIGVENKDTWVAKVCEVPLAEHSQPLCRFLLFAASNNAIMDQEKPGLLTRETVIPSDQLAYLNYSKWKDDKYATVEHVAPVSNSDGWDEEIYSPLDTHNLIGNIILLPQKENSSVGNAPWAKKKIFYRALVAEREPERNSQFEKAKEEGLTFKNQTIDLLNAQGRLDMLDPIAKVNRWTKSTIQKRTKNILQLAWDEISPWLGY
ncbi:MAG: DUF262 domain-containing HNH endonuclease family protein [Candidatus Poribacteria bacterium]|nr:DUF262 domain-containing HNH endonuclease family protein [Candidatus Poribacteria bacterium]